MSVKQVRVVDSHTAGEPTRVVIEGGPDLGGGSVAKRLERFRADYDHFRSGIVNEPRGSDVLVGALLCEPDDASCAAGVIFFNNVGYIGMCGHGTIGLVVTLAHLGRIGIGTHRIETPVGIVTAKLLDRARVTVSNVRSYRFASEVKLDVPGYGEVIGDVAWGGNWFFLVEARGLPVSADNTAALTTLRLPGASSAECQRACAARMGRRSITSKFSVLRPSRTCTAAISCSVRAWPMTARLAAPAPAPSWRVLLADGKLQPGEVWRQESVIGTVFEASFTVDEDRRDGVLPHITGAAYVTDEATLIFDEADPLCWGISQRV